jgi:hypothetical protein
MPDGRRRFVDYHGRDWAECIVNLDGLPYLAKRGDMVAARMDLLGYRLGLGRLNVPEVRLADDAMRADMANSACSHLVRLCQSYDPRTLPVRDLSTAIAGELVFSTWITRRDAHNHNRVFVRGVPMFFDFGVAFEVVPGEDRNSFFRGGPDPGWVQNWKLVRIPRWRRPDSNRLRTRERRQRTPVTVHPIHRRSRFWNAFDRYGAEFAALSDDAVCETVRSCGFDDDLRVRISSSLLRSRDELGSSLESIRKLLRGR